MKKGERTRAALLEAALELFAAQGFHETTMRDIATAAGKSPGLVYRYFPGKEALILELYARIARDLHERVRGELGPGTIGQRFADVTRFKLDLLGPHRETFRVLMSAMLGAAHPLGVLATRNAEIRESLLVDYTEVVRGASDRPASLAPELLGAPLYILHLLFVLMWLVTPPEREEVVFRALEFAEDRWSFVWMALRALPNLETNLQALQGILDAWLAPSSS